MISNFPLLEYESQIFLDSYHEDGLTIIAKGLGAERIFQNFIKLYLDPENLVIILNTTQAESEFFIGKLKADEEVFLPKIINSEVSSTARHSIYQQGGVLFVTTRIFIVDLLNNIVPRDISGLLVYNAHRVINSSQEVFCIKLFKDQNPTGFVKSFSDLPQAFEKGVIGLDVTIKNLSANSLHLWPRFHATLIEFFNQHKPEIIEIQIYPTKLMKEIQLILFELIQFCIKELRICCNNSSFLLDNLNLESIINKNFLNFLQNKLQLYWDQIGNKAQNLVLSIKTLRKLLIDLYNCDCFEYFDRLNQIRQNCLSNLESSMVYGGDNKHNLNWILEPGGESLYLKSKKRKILSESKSGQDNPKFDSLLKVIDTISIKSHTTPDINLKNDNLNLLIITHSDSTVEKLKNLLDKTRVDIGLKKNTAIGNVSDEKGIAAKPNKKIKTAVSDVEGNQTCNDRLKIEVISLDAKDLRAISLIEVHEPTHIVMFDPDLELIRKIEVYQSLLWPTGLRLHVYFMMYRDSVEEQLYLSSLRNEKEAFEHLIQQKGSLIFKQTSGEAPSTDAFTDTLMQPTSSRKAGGQANLLADTVEPVILVDMREFKSELPALLYTTSYEDVAALPIISKNSVNDDDAPLLYKHVKIIPTTLQIGDYILTPDICVERKTINDLVQSFNSGRLYQQAKAMTRTYTKPMLMIEFNSNTRPFILQSRATTKSLGTLSSSKSPAITQLNQEISILDIQSKLVLLTIAFPKLKLMWCCTPKMAAELFLEFKIGKPEPPIPTSDSSDVTPPSDLKGDSQSPSSAILSNTESSAKTGRQSFGHLAYDMLLKIPGISAKNVTLLTRKCDSLKSLIALTEEELNDIFQNSINSKKVWNFLHNEV